MAATSTIQVSRFKPSDSTFIRYSGNVVSNALQENRITEDDSHLIQEFVSEISATRNICTGRAYKITYSLTTIRDFVGPFRQNTIADIFTGIDRLRTATNPDGTPRYKQNSIGDLIRFLKRFYLWMAENHYTTIEEKKLNKIHPPGYDTETKTPEMLLSEEEVKAMIEACMNSRDRAIISTLYEGGLRIGEIASLRWKDVTFTDWNATITTSFKTGKTRNIPLVMAKSYLAVWRNDYPLPVTADSFVFLTNQKAPLAYGGVAKQLRVVAGRAGITKHITPHIFRHSRATHMIRQGYGESIVKKLLWGNLNSEMFSVYLHLVDSDVERVIAEKAGVAPKEELSRSKALEPRQCPRCYTVNGPTLSFCGNCGLELTEEAMDKVKQAKQQAELLPEYAALLDKFKTELIAMQQAKGSA
ncbi:MAG: site-specific integrase [Methanoregula sp.]|nr:site-specific integrase [Methanoregula sp.]